MGCCRSSNENLGEVEPPPYVSVWRLSLDQHNCFVKIFSPVIPSLIISSGLHLTGKKPSLRYFFQRITAFLCIDKHGSPLLVRTTTHRPLYFSGTESRYSFDLMHVDHRLPYVVQRLLPVWKHEKYFLLASLTLAYELKYLTQNSMHRLLGVVHSQESIVSFTLIITTKKMDPECTYSTILCRPCKKIAEKTFIHCKCKITFTLV